MPTPPSGSVTSPAAAGDLFPALSVLPGPEATKRYADASGDFTPFHLSEEAARAAGLPGIILHGLYSFAQVVRAHTAPYGGDPRVLVELAGRFRRPAFPDRPLVSELEVTEADADGSLRTGGALLQEGRAVIEEVEGTLRPR
jgi:acyl dehydratase